METEDNIVCMRAKIKIKIEFKNNVLSKNPAE